VVEDIQKVLGENLREWRSQRGLTQSQLAERAGVSWNTVQLIETGKRWVGVDNLVAFARVLDVPQAMLFNSAFPVPQSIAREITPKEALKVLSELVHKSSVLTPIERDILAAFAPFIDNEAEVRGFLDSIAADREARGVAAVTSKSRKQGK
jgi:transcriptional regulator with XRE-family HTH domain